MSEDYLEAEALLPVEDQEDTAKPTPRKPKKPAEPKVEEFTPEPEEPDLTPEPEPEPEPEPIVVEAPVVEVVAAQPARPVSGIVIARSRKS